MQILDLPEEVKKIDKGGVLTSIEKLPDQISQAWNEIHSLDVPQSCFLAKNVVVSGMGGSALGGRIVKSLLSERARTPIEVFTEYHLPSYVNKDTLVILCSYSGNTEETISAANEALNRGAGIFVVATGGKLKDFMEDNGLQGYIYQPRENPSNQPRMGLGYSITSILAVLAKCEFINLFDSEIKEIVDDMHKFISEYGLSVNSDQNVAKRLAIALKGKAPVIVASEHLVGVAHAFKNQLNENAKTFSCLFDIPEMNHHLMEGLRQPAMMKEYLQFLFLSSELYSREIRKRYLITEDVVKKNEISSSVYKLRSTRKICQIFEILILGSFISFYLAILYGNDPTPIPWVDYFKEQMAKA